MYAQNEQVHVGAWPSFSLYDPFAHALGAEVNNAASKIYAVEGSCFVLGPCATVSQAMIEELCDSPEKHAFLHAGGGYAVIYGPDGAPLAQTLPPDQEGLLYADIDLGMISVAKAAADPAGHYSRPDVTRLAVQQSSRQSGRNAGLANRRRSRSRCTGEAGNKPPNVAAFARCRPPNEGRWNPRSRRICKSRAPATGACRTTIGPHIRLSWPATAGGRHGWSWPISACSMWAKRRRPRAPPRLIGSRRCSARTMGPGIGTVRAYVDEAGYHQRRVRRLLGRSERIRRLVSGRARRLDRRKTAITPASARSSRC